MGSKIIKFVNFLGDIAIINISFIVAYYLKFQAFINFESLDIQNNLYYVVLLGIFNILWIVLCLWLDVNLKERGKKFDKILLNLIKAILLHMLLIFSVIVIFKFHFFSRLHLLMTYSSFFCFIFIWRFFCYYVLKIVRTLGFNYRKVVVIGNGPIADDLHHYFHSHVSNGFKFMGYFADNVEEVSGQIKGSVEDVKEFSLREKIDEIYCTLPHTSPERIADLMRFADNNLIRFRIVPDFRGFLNKKVQIDFYESIPVLSIRNEPLSEMFNRFIKRTFDIVFSLMVILLIFPWLFPILATLIKLSSKGPIFFKQLRSGKNNSEFYCYKFRTMRVNKESDEKQATRGDSRITWIGNILRKTSLDELPQFFNVLLGQMSVVGPRPHMLKHTQEYSQIVDKFMVRHFVKPGITGLAQVNGFRGETNTPEKMGKRVELDVWYLENWNFILDLKIVLQTVLNMIKGEKNAV